MIRNDVIRDKVRMASVADKMREGRLRWFRHVKRCEKLVVAGVKRRKGRTTKNWGEVIRHDLAYSSLLRT